MRVQLNRERNNEFEIPNSFIRKNNIRIMSVYEDGKLVDSNDYCFMGPRKIKMLREVEASTLYAKIMEIKKGNKLIV